jgi:putative cell wall-binding protein
VRVERTVSIGGVPASGYGSILAPTGRLSQGECVMPRTRSLLVVLTLVVGLFAAVGTAHAIPGSVTRVFGDNRYETAVAISQRINPPIGSAVVVTTGENYPDALAAGALAAKVGGVVLLVRPTSVPAVTLAEAVRIDPSTIYFVGGPAAMSSAVRGQLLVATGAASVSLDGPDRYGTSIAVSQTYAPASTYLTIATGRSYEDALLGGALASRELGVLLLVRGDQPLTQAQKDEIQRLEPFAIRVIGTTASISQAVYDEIDAISGGTGIQRVGDADVHQRAITMWDQSASFGGDVIFATSENWPDALVAGPLVAAESRMLLLSRTDCIPQVVATRLDTAAVQATSLLLVGGPAALSPAVAAKTVCS